MTQQEAAPFLFSFLVRWMDEMRIWNEKKKHETSVQKNEVRRRYTMVCCCDGRQIGYINKRMINSTPAVWLAIRPSVRPSNNSSSLKLLNLTANDDYSIILLFCLLIVCVLYLLRFITWFAVVVSVFLCKIWKFCFFGIYPLFHQWMEENTLNLRELFFMLFHPFDCLAFFLAAEWKFFVCLAAALLLMRRRLLFSSCCCGCWLAG